MSRGKWVTCAQCQLLRINGVVCHEIGCPNAWRDYKVECKNCDREFLPKVKGQTCCSKSCTKEYFNA